MATFPQPNPWDQIWRQNIPNYGLKPGVPVPTGNLDLVKPLWKPRQQVTLGPDLQFHLIEPVKPIETPEETFRAGVSKLTGPLAEALGLPAKLRDEAWKEFSGSDQTVPERALDDIIDPDSEYGNYVRARAAMGDPDAKNYVAGLQGALEGSLDPTNVALAPLGGKGALALMALGMPGMVEGVHQATELSDESDRQAALIKTVASLAAPVGLGSMWGAGHAGSFGKHAPEIDIPSSIESVRPFEPTVRPDQAMLPSDTIQSVEPLPTLGEETRFSDAAAAVKAMESAEANPITELNTNIWLANRPDVAALGAAHDVMQSPGALKAKSFVDALNSITGEGEANLGIADSRSASQGHVQGFQGGRGNIGAANPDINVSPAAVAHRLILNGVPEGQLVDAFYSELGRTTIHEGTHTGRKIPGAEAPIDQLYHGNKEFGTLEIQGETPETLTQNQAFEFLDPQRQAEYAGAKQNLIDLHKMSQDALTVQDIQDLAGRHGQSADILNSPDDVQVPRTVESLAEPVTFEEKMRVAEARDMANIEKLGASEEALNPDAWEPLQDIPRTEPVESVNVDELTPEPVEPIESISELELDIPKRLTHVSGSGKPYPLHWDEQGNPVLGLRPDQPMHTNADRFAQFGDEFDPRYTFKPKFTKPVEVTDPGGSWEQRFSSELFDPEGHDPVLRYRNQFENYGDKEWQSEAWTELNKMVDEGIEGLPSYISDASPELMAIIEKRLEARGVHSLAQMEDSYLVGRPNKLLEPETLTERITERPDEHGGPDSDVYKALNEVRDLEGEWPGLERDQALKAVFNEEVTRAENESPNRIDRWRASADAARQRILQRAQDLDRIIKKGGSESGAAPNIGEDIIDYSLILRHKLAQGAVDFATWTKELPEHLQEHAQRIWDSVQNYHAKASNPANMLKGKNLTKLTPEQLETFARLKTEDVAGILKTAEDPVAAAKLIVRAKHPSAPPETQRLLTQRLMQEQGIKPPPGKPPKAEVQGPPAPRPQSKVQSVEDYIGLKQSLETKQELTAREFTQYRSEGRQGLDDFEADPSKYPDAEKFLSDMFDYQKAHGVPINKLADYLPHLYEGSSKDIKAYNRWLTQQVGRLGLKPGHTLARKLASYKVAEQMFGLKPKFDNLPDLLGKYRYMAEKAVADRQLFDWAKDAAFTDESGVTHRGLISTVHKPGWVELPNFPVRHVKTAAGKPVEIKYFGEPAFAQKVNRVFQEPSTVAKILSGIASHGRNITLGAGIPGTGWNGYGLILMNRYVKSAPDIATGIGRVMHAVKDLTLTKQAGERVQGILDEIPDAIEHGLNLSTESRHWQPRDESLKTRLAAAEPFDIGRPRIQESKLGGAVLKKFTQTGEVVGTLFDRPLTERVLPLWKMIVYKQGIEDFTAQGLDPKAAKIKAAEWANNVMTGRNWQRAGSSPEVVAWSRVIFLAPDLLRSNMELGRGIGRSLVTRRGTPEAKLYRRYAKTAFTLFVAQQALSKALGGRPGWENPSGQAFSIYAGESDKDHERYIRPTLTSEDWARIPVELAAGFNSGGSEFAKKAQELLMNRTSTLVNWAVRIPGTFRNYAGVPGAGQDIPMGRAMLNFAEETSNLGTPPQLGWGLEALKHVEPIGDLAREYKLGRKRTPEEILVGLLEAPVSYIKKRPKKKAQPLGIFDFHQNFSKSKKGGEDDGGVEVVFK